MPVALGQVLKARSMTLRFKPATHKYKDVQAERDLMGACQRLSRRVLKFVDRGRKRRFVKCEPALAMTIVIAFFLTSSAIAQERPRAYSEYTYWFDGAFENGHAFSSTVGARTYQLQYRYGAAHLFEEALCRALGFRRSSHGTGRRPIHQIWSPSLFLRHWRQSYRRASKLRAFPACRAISHKRWRLSVLQPSHVWNHPAVQLYCSTRRWSAAVHIQSPHRSRSWIQISPHLKRESRKPKSRIGFAYVVRRVVVVSLESPRFKCLYAHVGAALTVALILSFSALAQITQPAPRAATVIGTATDLNGDVISNATVVLEKFKTTNLLRPWQPATGCSAPV
jgi:hypothetical protein